MLRSETESRPLLASSASSIGIPSFETSPGSSRRMSSTSSGLHLLNKGATSSAAAASSRGEIVSIINDQQDGSLKARLFRARLLLRYLVPTTLLRRALYVLTFGWPLLLIILHVRSER
ncbi:unnamed protein product, partial [Amoebophrya sp. A25]|eukprot:GSA25T00026664001.1